ncbi:hypothetical protein Terro_1940 [Terriglobus roseus DSM 18391]|uniref:Uncharacterized protein n=1 Tax=Terriglobus roseus (strain DSM 18391 / NRRL B-41598 / KBS 63) TaxID=926566 RepID=I3ZG58_TERRK|nr:hypothetical protein [Terriglobus roseus]AFL88226.1 hypothetical protein Terro_1940 [Terriglobus roseus DSM 18391]
MSTVAHPTALGSIVEYAAGHWPARTVPICRRTTPTQGRALEILGHAVEYLADSRLYDPVEVPSDGTAIRTLMSCSRQVFAECELIQPWHQRVQTALLWRRRAQKIPGR